MDILDKTPASTIVRRVRLPALFACLGALCLGGATWALMPPAGLDARQPIGAYLDGLLPTTEAGPMPALLSQTGVFTDLAARTPHAGLVPYALNSPLWTDGAIKSRYIGMPYDGTPASPRASLTALNPSGESTGGWSFPNGTVIVKNFDMLMDERPGATGALRRLETRILVRSADGSIRGATYKWRMPSPGYFEADLVTSRTNETLSIIQADGSTRTQTYLYPRPSDCVRCHNANAGMVLGIKTAQLNGDFTYAATGRTDNQLHTWDQLGMLDATPGNPAQLPKMVDVTDTTAPLETRFKSYIAANCSHCHRPEGEGPLYDMRFETPILAQNIFAPGGMIRRQLANSRFFDRDASTFSPMPPLARDLPDARIVAPGALYDQWVNYPFDVVSVTVSSATQLRVRFDRAVDAATATALGNYALNGAGVTHAAMDTDPAVVVLTTSALSYATGYTLKVTGVKETTAPYNPIWPDTAFNFTTPMAPSAPAAPTIVVAAAGNAQASFTLAANGDGGSPITGYMVRCDPGAFTATGAATTLTVTGLANGTAYGCRASVSNGIGTSASSAVTNVTPFTVPGAPINLSAMPGDGRAILSFEAAPANGSAITGYAATCNPGAFAASGSASPLVVSGLVNGTQYSCTVAASNGAGAGPPSAPATVTPAPLPPPVLIAAFSRKTHAGAGAFDLPLTLGATSGAAMTVEPRAIGAGHQIVFRFDRAVASVGGVSASAGVHGVSVVAGEVVVTLTGIADGQRVDVSVSGVDGTGTGAVSVGFLLGDVSQSGAVDTGDLARARARGGQACGNDNFRYDINASGVVGAADVALIKARMGRVLP